MVAVVNQQTIKAKIEEAFGSCKIREKFKKRGCKFSLVGWGMVGGGWALVVKLNRQTQIP